MRLLADENFPNPIVESLRAEGRDGLLVMTESEARIVLTLDKDVWQIAVQHRRPLEQSGVVLFRIHPATARILHRW